jgi:hypothetical protein
MSEFDPLKYFMAAEKVGNLIFCLDQTLEFVEEFKIVPDENVKQALKPHLDKMMEWIKD